MDKRQIHNLKEIAARYAVNHFIQSGTNVGLGTGSTAAFAVIALADRIRAENLTLGHIVATSAETEKLARFHGMTVSRDFSAEVDWLDITIDGADEVDPNLDVIKGGGGALLREKLVAARTLREVIIVDAGKSVSVLGKKHPLPVMVVPYAWETTAERLAAVCERAVHRRVTPTGDIFVSDDGLYCLDIVCGPIPQAAALESRIKAITGVVDVGLFVGMAQTVVIADAEGRVSVQERPASRT